MREEDEASVKHSLTHWAARPRAAKAQRPTVLARPACNSSTASTSACLNHTDLGLGPARSAESVQEERSSPSADACLLCDWHE
ncbi:hypothetical protein ZWY2020_059766 [Hordeum vulgare]|nr:hypothetical protein ZWY2020_059766 [Hordeum vulgare]